MKQILKAVTFSYDDGVESDIRLLEIFNKYGIRATFNLNSALAEEGYQWTTSKGMTIKRMTPKGLKQLYEGHEIAVHGARHLWPSKIETKEGFIKEFFEDILALDDLFDKRIQGMAYAFGDFNEQTKKYLKGLGLNYGRTVKNTHSFDLQSDLLEFNPTCHHDDENIFEIIERFTALDADKPQILYIWGHSYEFDEKNNWDRIEKICKMLAGREDIFYGTNTEVFEYFGLY